MKLKGRVAIVTGASRGIGQAIAVAYAEEGAKLVLAARTVEGLEETKRKIDAVGGEALIIPTDMGDDQQIAAMVDKTLSQYGSVDILVNNAGVIGPMGRPHEVDPEEWKKTIDINLNSPYMSCRAVIPVMIRQGGGKIINVTGAGGASVYPAISALGAYATSKAAILRMTEMIAFSVEEFNIEVNALGPGAVDTGMWQEIKDAAETIGHDVMISVSKEVMGGAGAPIQGSVDIALFLASDDSNGMTGRLVQQELMAGGKGDDLEHIKALIPEIKRSSILKLRRVNPRSP